MALPPTGIQQQAMGQQPTGQMGVSTQPMGQRNAGIRQLPGQQAGASQPLQMGSAQSQGGMSSSMPTAQTSLSQLANQMARNYGLPMTRQDLVDASGNMTMTPDQIVAASGGKESLGSAAAKMNYISAAISRQQNEAQARKAEAALGAGAGLVQSRGRGSAALMQSGYYQNLAQLYDNQEYEAADFSYFIIKEQMDFQRDMMRRAEKLAKKRGIGGMIGGALGAIGGAILGGPAGAGIGMQAGSALGSGAGFF